MAAKDKDAPKFNVCVHSDVSTAYYGPWAEARCKMEANSIMQVGFWVGNRLYPANRVTYIELQEVKS